jgi:hypothetical protein
MKLYKKEDKEKFKKFSIEFETDEEARVLRALLGHLCLKDASFLNRLYDLLNKELIEQGFEESYIDDKASRLFTDNLNNLRYEFYE